MEEPSLHRIVSVETRGCDLEGLSGEHKGLIPVGCMGASHALGHEKLGITGKLVGTVISWLTWVERP